MNDSKFRSKIEELYKSFPNDFELGREVRQLMVTIEKEKKSVSNQDKTKNNGLQ
jgi:hypothetical protein